MSKPRVLHIVSSLRRGGRERQLALIQVGTRASIESRIAVTALYDDDYRAEYGLRPEEIILLDGRGKLRHIRSLKAAIADFRPDVVWCWGKKETLFAMLLKPRYGFRIVSGFIRAARFMFGAGEKYFWLVLASMLRYVVGNSLSGMKLYRLRHGYLLRNGYVFNQASAEAAKELQQRLNLPPDLPVMVSVANLIPVKDYVTVLQALALLRNEGIDFRYLVLGEGNMRKNIEEQIGALGLNQQVLLQGSVANVPDYLAVADIFVHSSFSEGTSNAIIEAMLTGLPVVASATGGTPEIVQSDWGFPFECQNVEELTTILRTLLKDRNLRTEYGRRACEYATNEFALERMLQRYSDIVADATENRTDHRITL